MSAWKATTWVAPAAALLFLLIAVFLPPINTPQTTYDYLVVFDITQSMNVEDYESNGIPVSRLTFARDAVRRTLHRSEEHTSELQSQ